jgi:hypothetical protein
MLNSVIEQDYRKGISLNTRCESKDCTYSVAAVFAPARGRCVTDTTIPAVGDDDGLGAIGTDVPDGWSSVCRAAPGIQEQVNTPKNLVNTVC